MSASNDEDKGIDIKKIASILIAVLMISAGFVTLLQFAADTGSGESYPAEHFVGFDLESGTWVNSDLGKAYMEGDFVSYQLRLDSSSKIWGAEEFSIKYNFYQGSTNAIFVDGFDTSVGSGFQYSTGDMLADGVQVPSSGWGTHIPTPEAGETAAFGDPQIVNYMNVWEVGDPDSEAAPNDMRYFTIKNIPWEDFTDGHVILFFRAHLALSIIWRNDLEVALPQALDGNEFQGWTGASPHFGSSYASGSSRHFTIEYPGVGGKAIPIPITSYPTNLITGRKLINNVPYDGWVMNLEGRLSLWGGTGDDYVYIPFNPPAVVTGNGPWALGYFAFDGLPRGNFTVWEDHKEGFILDVIGTSPYLNLYAPGKLPYFDAVTESWMDNPDANERVRFDLDRGTKVSPKVQNIDFYNLQVGNLSGYKVHDIDGDGSIDDGDTGLAGWSIELWEEDGLSPVRVTTTDDDGYFEFKDVVIGNYSVKEVMQDGWFNTTSDSISVRVDPGSDIDDLLFLNTMYSSICGYKVQDIDGDGVWDENDPVIYNWEIQLFKGDKLIDTTWTDESGRFCFDGIVPGHYTVTEVLPSNWYCTDEISFAFDIESGDHEEVVFLNSNMVSISGYKYEDLMGDGVYDDGEDLGISGWTIYLYEGAIEPDEAPIRSNVTDANGRFSFTGLEVGTYTVVEESRLGWYNTTPGQIEVTLLSGESEELMFLNTEYAEICGYKYEDMNGDGRLDDGDPAVQGWEVELWFDGVYQETTFTDECGRFCFDMITPGTYVVKEVMQEDWYATTPEEVEISKVSGGDDGTVTFLNTRYGDICVFKYEDLDGDGEWDEGEPGMPGVTVELFEPLMERALSSEPTPIRTGVTNETGMVCFHGLFLGTYLVVEYPPLGTYPNTEGTSKLVEITTSNQSVPVTFGNIENGKICVLKYEDIDGDGVLDEDETTPLSGVLVTLYDAQMVEIANGTTGECPCGCGGICFSGLALGTYFVRETVADGWFNTTPAQVQVVLDVSGETEQVFFLNSEYSSISGNKYQDLDGDGFLDLDDMPVENWEIQLWRDDVYVATNWTDDEGYFFFGDLVPGNYYVIEIMQEGWYATTTTEVYVRIDSGVHVGDVLFLNTIYSSVCVFKYEDLNGDGQWTDDEPAIPDWEFKLYRMADEVPTFVQMVGGWVLVATNSTDDSGRSCFTGLVPGLYRIEEVMQDGWYNTTEASHVFEITSGDRESFTFLNTEMGRICGYKVEDLNGNGQRDEDEVGVEGWHIELWKDGEFYSETWTAADGSFCFANLSPGDYVVYEGENSSWYNTSADFAEREISSGTVVDDIVFLNTRYGQVCVLKYEDENGNGVRDEGEDVLVDGVFIELLLGQTVIGSGYTGQSGSGAICFTGLELGDYMVRETLNEGWYTVGPLEQSAVIDLSGESIELTFVNIRLGQICVFKYHDLDGDGLRDGNEPVKAGVTIELLYPNGTLIESAVTDECGMVCFTGLVLGDYVVNETVPEGWYATNGTSFEVSVETSGQYIEVEFLNTEFGRICVYKYEDLNGNGVLDEDEPAVSGVFIELLRDGKVIANGTTDDDGRICFTGLYLDEYLVRETVPEGWYNTNPTEVSVTIDQSGEGQEATFLNTRYGQICVFKYEDLNGNGVNDDEPVVEGVFIELMLDGEVVASGCTDCYGMICFTGLKLGDYTVNETVQEGWYATSPTSVGVSLAASGDHRSVEFLNARYGSICVYKYEDLDGDGEWDEGEDHLIDGVAIVLRNVTGEIVDTGVTGDNGDGTVCFTNLVIGVYTVEETVPQGWYATSGTTRSVGLEASGDQNCTYFLNTMYGRICVFKFEDLNGDGEWQENEPAVSNVTIELRDLAGGLIETNVTDCEGIACFCGLMLGSYVVIELVPEGWYADETNQFAVLEQSGETVWVEFSNLKYSKICVQKIEDENGNGIRDEGEETPISGVFIELLLDGDVIASGYTDCYGMICFTDLVIGEYTVRETVPEGWYNTTLAEVVEVIEGSGQSKCVTFLNTEYGDICVQKYEDVNGNGEMDEGDRPASGVIINLWLGDGIIATNETDRDGIACFHMLRLGAYKVQEVLPEGWYTDGLLIQGAVIEGSGDHVQVTFLNIRYGEICVWKYEDVNGNGLLDDGDAVVPGILITLYDAQMNEIANGTTGECGGICFSGLVLGTYFVGETLTDEWYTEGPTLKQVSVNESGDVVCEHFLNIRYGKICVFKFEDLNGDGVWQENEPGLSGVVIQLVQDCKVVRTGVTNATGWVCFELLRFGSYIVRENLALSDMGCCWYPSTPDRVSVTLSVENQHQLVIFGNVKYGKICGWKYLDENQNGRFDECTEHGIAGWTIQLWKDGVLFGTMTTDSRGHFCFAGLEFGEYVVTEVMQDGWYATGQISWNVTIDRSGDREDVFFLNAPCGDICVYKYEDLDGDGVLDEGEPAVPGITVYLYQDNVLVGSGVTDENGRYCFEDLKVGTYAVMEEIPCNWYATAGRVQQAVMTGQDVTVTFLNTRYGCIGGFKFNDANGNGVWDMLTESGIAGWEIELYQGEQLISWSLTDADGHYAFCGLRLGDYTVKEVMQDGWMATAPTEIMVTLETSGQLVCNQNFLNKELNPCIDVDKSVVCDTITWESHTQGYWKNHECSWVGIRPYDRFPWVNRCAYPCGLTYLGVFGQPPAGDATLILAHQYIAAKLNYLKWGAPVMYNDLIAEAEAFLAMHPIGSCLTKGEKAEATELADLLTAYNEGEGGLTVLTYTVTVTNCGNVELYNVKLYDSLLEQWFYLCDFGDGDGILGIGEWWTISYTYVVPVDICEESEDTCGGWTWEWEHGCGGGCHYGDNDNDCWSWSWGCGDRDGRHDGGCGGWNWNRGYGTGCGAWTWCWSHHCGGGCDEEPAESCVITNIATAYGQWGAESAGTWVSDSDQVNFRVQQECPNGDDDDGCGYHDWNWNWGGGCGDHDWGCDHDGGWSWSGCGWIYQNLNFGGCRWWGLFSDGMIGACHVWNGYGTRDDARGKEETEAVEEEK